MVIRWVFLLAAICFAVENVQYTQVCGKQVLTCDWTVSDSFSQFVRGNESQKIWYTSDKCAKKFHYNNDKEKSSYTIYRKGNSLKVTGVLQGKELDSLITISSLPWYQSMQDFADFALSEKNKEVLFYYVVRPGDLKTVKMKAVKVKKKSNSKVQVVKVTPIGIGSLFWCAHYTYRLKDGAFLQYRSVNGGPGTPETVITLVE